MFPTKTHNDKEDVESVKIEERISIANAFEALKEEDCINIEIVQQNSKVITTNSISQRCSKIGPVHSQRIRNI